MNTNEPTTEYRRWGLSPDEIAFAGASGRARLYLGFYWNRRLPPLRDLEEALGDPKVGGVITDIESVRKVGLEKGDRGRFKVVPLRRELVLIVKRPRSSDRRLEK